MPIDEFEGIAKALNPEKNDGLSGEEELFFESLRDGDVKNALLMLENTAGFSNTHWANTYRGYEKGLNTMKYSIFEKCNPPRAYVNVIGPKTYAVSKNGVLEVNAEQPFHKQQFAELLAAEGLKVGEPATLMDIKRVLEGIAYPPTGSGIAQQVPSNPYAALKNNKTPAEFHGRRIEYLDWVSWSNVKLVLQLDIHTYLSD